jgi:hypothetical protein
MITSELARSAQIVQGGTFNVGTLLLFVGGAILLAFFCSIGVIARLRENRLTERRETAAKAKLASALVNGRPQGQGDRPAAGDPSRPPRVER